MSPRTVPDKAESVTTPSSDPDTVPGSYWHGAVLFSSSSQLGMCGELREELSVHYLLSVHPPCWKIILRLLPRPLRVHCQNLTSKPSVCFDHRSRENLRGGSLSFPETHFTDANPSAYLACGSQPGVGMPVFPLSMKLIREKLPVQSNAAFPDVMKMLAHHRPQ